MKPSIERQVTLGFALALVMVGGIGFASWRTSREFVADAAAVKRAQEILTRLESLLSTMTDAETGQRGFTVTGDERFLEPYHQAVAQTDVQVRELRRSIADPAQQRRLESLVPLLAARLEFSRQVVELRRSEGFEAARREIATGKGKAIQDRIRLIVREMREAETLILHQREERTHATARRVVWTASGGSLVALAWLGVALVVVQRGLAARWQAEQRVQASEVRSRQLAAQFTAIFESSPNGIVVVNAAGLVSLVNVQIEKAFGYTRAELIGQPVELLVPERFRGSHPAHRGAFFAEPQARAMGAGRDLSGRRKDGSEFPVEIGLSPVATAEGLAVLAAVVDVTERKRADDLLRAKNEELRVATVQAQAADRLKSAFLATMSHELRTPLNSIIGFTGILLQGLAGPLNDEQRKQLGMVQGSARHLLALINDVLDISKIEAGELKVSCEPFDLRAVIEKAVATVRPQADKKGLALRAELSADIAGATSDARRVEQILLNLLTNAIKFTARGEVVLSAEVADSAACIRVVDTGLGIKPEDMATLFKPFQQIDTGLARNHEGTGLGLAICRRLAGLLGGEIRADSQWGQGSTFTFTLPLRGPGTS